MDRLADGADRLGKTFHRMVRRHVARFEVHLGGAAIVARDEAVKNFRQEPSLFRPKPSHDAEIDRDQPAFMIDKQIARMHVGVKKAVAQGMAEEGLDHGGGKTRQIEALGLQCLPVGERRRLDPFQREHVFRGPIPVHRRHAEIRIVPGILRHLGERRPFEPQIHFHRHRALERGHHFDQAQPPRFRGERFRLACRVGESIEVDAEAPRDARPQYLDRDVARAGAGRDFGPMHLRDGGRRHHRPEFYVQRIEGLAERRRHRGFGLLLGERRHLVLQGFQIARERNANHVGPGCQKLPELHVGRSEPGERGGEPMRRTDRARPLDQPHQAQAESGHARQRFWVDQAEHALPRQHDSGAAESHEVSDAGNHDDAPAKKYACITAASRSAAPPRRRSARDSRRGGSQRRASYPRSAPATGTAGSTR